MVHEVRNRCLCVLARRVDKRHYFVLMIREIEIVYVVISVSVRTKRGFLSRVVHEIIEVLQSLIVCPTNC